MLSLLQLEALLAAAVGDGGIDEMMNSVGMSGNNIAIFI